MDSSNRIVASTKTLTSHDNPARAAIEGTSRALSDLHLEPKQVSGFVHGTTLATNALIERKGAVVATVTTAGFKDILDIANERRYDQYDINLEKPDLLVPRDCAFTISERTSVSGEVLIELAESEVPALVDQIKRSGAEAVAICLIHAYANSTHEQRLRSMLQLALPQLSISISSEVSPEAREFDRLCTTVANAYIQPLMARYLDQFEKRFASEGIRCRILMMTASGGMTTLGTAARFPIRLVESGPAGGAILAAHTARSSDLEHVLSFDMGGTTAKLCLIDSGVPQSSRQFEIARAARFIKGSGMPVRIPVLEMIEIGAGGGSIATVDRLGRLTVGPDSAGSEPGPVAFDRGGDEPTVTDADIVLGYIQAETFAEGQFTINEKKAREVITKRIGRALTLDAHNAADGISRIVDESMASAARMHAVESGKDLGSRTMIAFGGNGPLHACRVARSAGVTTIVVPLNPGVGSAVGFLYAPVSYSIVRSRYSLLLSLDCDSINSMLEDMSTEATEVVRQANSDGQLNTTRSAFMRYSGQGHEIEIALPAHRLGKAELADLGDMFEHAYARHYSRPVPGMTIEILNWSVRVATSDSLSAAERDLNHPADIVETDRASSDRASSDRASSGKAKTEQTANRRVVRPVDFVNLVCDVTNRLCRAGCIPRSQLQPGDVVHGPLLITEAQTTTFVGVDFSLVVDSLHNLVLSRTTSADVVIP